MTDDTLCPRCGCILEYDEVDIGVGVQRGNYNCPNCLWTPPEMKIVHDITDEELGQINTDWEQRTGHRQEVHPPGYSCENLSCNVCNLSICSICGGSEGSLLPKCPGRRLTQEEDEQNYRDYCGGNGPFAKDKTP